MVFPAPLEPTMATTAPAGTFKSICSQNGRTAVIVAESWRRRIRSEFENGGKAFAPGVFHFFFGQIEERENLRRSAERLQEELIDGAEPFDRLVGFEEREGEGAERIRWSCGPTLISPRA